jgi:hypothetical protein
VLVIYTFYLLDQAGSVCGFEFEGCSDDDAARELARQMLDRHPARAAVEVQRGAEVICRIARDAADIPREPWAPARRKPSVGGSGAGPQRRPGQTTARASWAPGAASRSQRSAPG